ncbi:hypothetical protein [Anaerotruncus colihominis]|uniref:hypothetical protein n=1 Tax=Anaerotruncus colihominis TaxID=169435 RepID=UPI0013629837|nr:hypothetical protein [Anaerotruncus colihominis]
MSKWWTRYHAVVNPEGKKEARTDHTTQPIISRLTLKGKPEGDHSMTEYTGRSSFTGGGVEG